MLDEGKNILIEEFGKEYGIYFSILELIASGKTSRSEIESIIQKDVGGYLERLENYYDVIEKFRPIHVKPQSKMIKYRIQDLFLKFWFRFIFRELTAIETANFRYVKQVLYTHLPSYKGVVLENFFRQVFAESKDYNQIGSYWESDNSHEIDLVAINDLQKKIVIAEVKLKREKVRMGGLEKKGERLMRHYPGYTLECCGLGLEDVILEK